MDGLARAVAGTGMQVKSNLIIGTIVYLAIFHQRRKMFHGVNDTEGGLEVEEV